MIFIYLLHGWMHFLWYRLITGCLAQVGTWLDALVYGTD
jgi:hypothetical protein